MDRPDMDALVIDLFSLGLGAIGGIAIGLVLGYAVLPALVDARFALWARGRHRHDR